MFCFLFQSFVSRMCQNLGQTVVAVLGNLMDRSCRFDKFCKLQVGSNLKRSSSDELWASFTFAGFCEVKFSKGPQNLSQNPPVATEGITTNISNDPLFLRPSLSGPDRENRQGLQRKSKLPRELWWTTKIGPFPAGPIFEMAVKKPFLPLTVMRVKQ